MLPLLLRPLRLPFSGSTRALVLPRRPLSFSATHPLLKHVNYPPRPKPPPDEEIDESFLKGSGPGGQKIVRPVFTCPFPSFSPGTYFHHTISHSTLSHIKNKSRQETWVNSQPAPKQQNKTNSAVQLKHLPSGIVVKCQATRSRTQNRVIARQLLADKLDQLTRGDDCRAAVVGQFKRKKKASSAKKSRRKYRKLEEEKEGRMTAAEPGEDGEEEDVAEYEEDGEEDGAEDGQDADLGGNSADLETADNRKLPEEVKKVPVI